MPELRMRAVPLVMALLLVACGDPEAERQKLAAAAAARNEAEAQKGLAQFNALIADGRIELAYTYGSGLAQRFPNTAVAKSLQPQLPDLKSKAEVLAEARRLEQLWTYHAVDVPETKGTQYTAYMYGVPAEKPAPKLQLVLRRHPEWGQSVYLLIEDGDFACAKLCKVPFVFDGGAASDWEISRAEGNVPPAVFIEADQKALQAIDAAKTLQITLPLADRRSIAYRFDVGGLDPSRLGPPPKP